MLLDKINRVFILVISIVLIFAALMFINGKIDTNTVLMIIVLSQSYILLNLPNNNNGGYK